MDTNEKIVSEVKKLAAEDISGKAQLRKSSYVDGYQGAMKDVRDRIELIESFASGK